MQKLILLFLLIPTLVFADSLTINGTKQVYNKNLKKHTFDYDPPANPQVNEVFTDLDNNNTYIWDGDSWELERKDTQIREAIVDFKAMVIQIQDPTTRQAIKLLAKIVFALYQENY